MKTMKKIKREQSEVRTLLNSEGRSETVTVKAGESLVYVFFTKHVKVAAGDMGKPGAGAPEQELNFILSGRQASVEVIGMDIARTDAAKVKLTVRHAHGDTRSQAQVKSVLGGNAHGEVHGLIKIEKGADGSDAYFAHRTLLLAGLAGAEQPHNRTVPALEIEANEVKAGHASTTGTFDALDVFYLQSRGLDAEAAQQIVLEGFVMGALEKIADDSTRMRAMKLAQERLAELQKIR